MKSLNGLRKLVLRLSLRQSNWCCYTLWGLNPAFWEVDTVGWAILT